MAIDFNSLTYAQTTNVLTPPDDSSISFWMFPTLLTPFITVTQRIVGNHTDYEIRLLYSGGNWKISNEMGGDSDILSNTNFSDDNWYHIICTYNDDQTGKIYVNGELDNSGDLPESIPSGYFRIGASPQSEMEGFRGWLEDVRLYNRELEDEEAATIYACRGSDNIKYGLSYRWMLDELPDGAISSATEVVKDCGPNQYHATPNFSLTWKGTYLKGRQALRRK